LKSANGAENIEEEYGDLLFAVVNLGRHLGITPEIALTKASDKFIKRFGKMEEEATKKDLDMSQMNLEELDLLWENAKKA
ncbi:MAG: nucleoside triphosphate pyrophosphohydrolase, partial [Clostridia bacterium]|nr:nucleoside triphosphate pyrophosphohydrolase [Clostridia bacterium]